MIRRMDAAHVASDRQQLLPVGIPIILGILLNVTS